MDCVRLLHSNEIGHKSVTVANMQQPVLCRYLRLTYTVRQLYNTVCTIPLGRFHGTRFYSAWQVYGSANQSIAGGNKEQRPGQLAELLRLAEQMRANYEQSCTNLKECLRWARLFFGMN